MNSENLNAAIERSEMVIARSGYTTVMDLAKLGTKAIFIPTPGQTEQEYIADELVKRQIAFSIKQSEFNLENALNESANFGGFSRVEHDNSFLQSAIQSIV
jgi:UDP-N-acetylglucosamine:LPS N-acetylglucosamine transferase